MQTDQQLAILRRVLDNAESVRELAEKLDLRDADPVRLGAFHAEACGLVRNSVRFCWSYARLLGIKADVVDQRLLSRAFFNMEPER